MKDFVEDRFSDMVEDWIEEAAEQSVAYISVEYYPSRIKPLHSSYVDRWHGPISCHVVEIDRPQGAAWPCVTVT